MNAAWNAVARVLRDAGCGLVAGVPADEYSLLDAARAVGGVRTLSVRDQRVAGCSAIAYATIAREPVVLALTSGPSFATALVAIAEAASLCVPMIVVTTRVAQERRGRGAFQELDQVSLAAPLVKWFFVVEDSAQAVWALRHACYLSQCATPGVTLIEMAAEALVDEPSVDASSAERVRVPRSRPADDEVQRAVDRLRAARRPVIVAGGGSKAAGAGSEIVRVAELIDAPVFTTAAGRGAIDETSPAAFGLVGLYATPPADKLLEDADVVLAVGTRLEETAQMGLRPLSGNRLIHVDANPAVLHLTGEPAVALLGDARETLAAICERLAGHERDKAAWATRLRAVKTAMRAWADGFRYESNPVPVVLRALSRTFAGDATFVCDNGLHDIWAYHYPLLEIGAADAVVVPGEQTMMGFAPMSSPGAALASSRRTIVLCGDGAFSVALSAVASAAEMGAPVLYVVFDNGALGWPKRGRDVAGDASSIADLVHADSLTGAVRAFKGYVASPATEASMERALIEAKQTANIALVRIAVPLSDVPVGVARASTGALPAHGET